MGLWKGNLVFCYYILYQSLCKFTFHERIKYYIKNTIPNYQFLASASSALAAGFTTAIFSYPFDLTYTRIACELNKGKYASLKDYNFRSNFGKFLGYYDGFSYAIIENGINSAFVFAAFQIIRSQKDSNTLSDNTNLFFISTAVGIGSSLITYPLNTFRRIIQLKGMEECKPTTLKFSDVVKAPHKYYQ